MKATNAIPKSQFQLSFLKIFSKKGTNKAKPAQYPPTIITIDKIILKNGNGPPKKPLTIKPIIQIVKIQANFSNKNLIEGIL